MVKEIHTDLKDASDQSIIEIYAKPVTEDQTLITFTLNEAGKNFLTNSLDQAGLPYRIKRTSNNDYKIEVDYKKEQKQGLMPFLFDYVIDQLKISNPNALHDIEFSMFDYCEYKLKTQSFDTLYDQLRAWNKDEFTGFPFPRHGSKESINGDFDTFDYPLSVLGILCEKEKKFGEALLCYAITNSRGYLSSIWWDLPTDEDFCIILAKMITSAIDRDPKSESGMFNIIDRFGRAKMQIFLEYLLDNYSFKQTFKLINTYAKSDYDDSTNVYSLLGTLLLKRGLKNEATLCLARAKDEFINPNSLMPLLGGSSNCVVYGTSSARYSTISDILNAYSFCDFPFYDAFKNMEYTTYKHCKSTITRLIAKNYELALENKPLIPLLFCVSYENKATHEKYELDLSKIANPTYSTITGAELRHCYRLANEMPPDIQAIARQTIKFIHVSKKGRVIDLKQIEPFWVNTDFKTALDKYRQVRAGGSSKRKAYSWQQYLLQSTYIERERFGFFNREMTQDSALHCDKKRRLS